MKGVRRLRTVARRCVWWKPPEETLRDTPFFLAHAMTFGDFEDALSIRAHFSKEELKDALRNAPAGVFDARSWHYWHHVVGISDVPPRPVRKIPGMESLPPTSKLDWARKAGDRAE